MNGAFPCPKGGIDAERRIDGDRNGRRSRSRGPFPVGRAARRETDSRRSGALLTRFFPVSLSGALGVTAALAAPALSLDAEGSDLPVAPAPAPNSDRFIVALPVQPSFAPIADSGAATAAAARTPLALPAGHTVTFRADPASGGIASKGAWVSGESSHGGAPESPAPGMSSGCCIVRALSPKSKLGYPLTTKPRPDRCSGTGQRRLEAPAIRMPGFFH
jgi:hypothetical protein